VCVLDVGVRVCVCGGGGLVFKTGPILRSHSLLS
jgi:hypothetical protein